MELLACWPNMIILYTNYFVLFIPSIYTILSIVSSCSRYSWDVNGFQKLPRGYWLDKKQQRLFMDDLAKRLHVKEFDDWYKISRSVLESNFRKSKVLLSMHKSLFHALTRIYPEYPQNGNKYNENSHFALEKRIITSNFPLHH